MRGGEGRERKPATDGGEGNPSLAPPNCKIVFLYFWGTGGRRPTARERERDGDEKGVRVRVCVKASMRHHTLSTPTDKLAAKQAKPARVVGRRRTAPKFKWGMPKRGGVQGEGKERGIVNL